ncbi:hypothetical protein PT974_10795 [Cladobotryum mycophilum]|uniref:Uncharacterized protein n=1 Tax=Cladobotryum mycophilum TaxID=491253 RepID=A0ABR0SBF0_9HYPO
MASRVRTKTAPNNIVELINRTLDTTKHIRDVRIKVQGSSGETAESFLVLVRDAHGLQTAAVGKQVGAIVGLIQELESILDELADRSLSNNFLRHKLMDGDDYDSQLKDINSRFEKAIGQVSEEVVEAPVGLSENHPEGYRVAFNVPNDTNNKVNQVLKMNLALMEYLQKRQMVNQIAPDGTIALKLADVEQFKQRAPGKSSDEDLNHATELRNTSVDGNIVKDDFRLVTGNIDVGTNYISAFNGHTTVRNNRMGNNARILTGDVGGKAAQEMMKDFW